MIIFYIGVDKCGSTAIYNILRKQNWISDLGGKDTNLLIDNKNIHSNITKLKNCGNNSIFIEYSHDYWLSSRVAKIIKDEFKEAFVICSVRDPILRTISALKHYKKIGTKGSDHEIIKNFPDIISNSYYKKLKDFLIKSGKFDDKNFFIVNIDSQISLIKQLNLCMSKFGVAQEINNVSYKTFSAKNSRFPILTNLLRSISKYVRYIFPTKIYQSLKNKFYAQEFLFKDFDNSFDSYWKEYFSNLYGLEMLSEYNSILEIKDTSND